MNRPLLLSRRTLLGAAAAAAATAATTGCSRGRSDEPAPSGPARLATGNEGGVYSTYGNGLARLVSELTGVSMTTMPTDGSVQNLRMLSSGTADLGFSLADSAIQAYEGTGEFKSGGLRLRALARVYDNYVHVVVPTNSPVARLADLKGKEVSVGPAASGTLPVAQKLLDAAGIQIKPKFLSLRQATKQLEERQIEALIWSGGLPTEPIRKLQSSIGFRLVNLAAEAQAVASRGVGPYVPSSIPPSVYSLTSSVSTLAVPNYLLTRRNLSDSWAWWTLNTMFRQQADLIKVHPQAGSLDARSAIATMPIPLHPAAERWYRTNHV